jgi:hypothetical protein
LSLADGHEGALSLDQHLEAPAITRHTHNLARQLIAVSSVGLLKRAERLPSRASTSAIFSPSVIASSTIILAPQAQIYGSTPTVLSGNSAHGSQYHPGARPVDAVPVGGGPESLGSSWAEHVRFFVGPGTFGAALKYAENELPKIKLYLKNGACELDDNWIENMIRPFALGRKNLLLSKTIRGADASASIYTVVQTAKQNGLNVQTYLESVFERLPRCETLEDL